MRERSDSDAGDRRDSDVSGRRDTHRGLGEVEASFTPSDSGELTPEELSLSNRDAFDFHFPSDAKVPSIPEDDKPLDEIAGTSLPGIASHVTQRSPDRHRFDTSAGGGSNRVSGGRDVARAYVAPMTPAPVHLRVQDTISIEVSEQVNQFDTIPSLTRRRMAEEDFFSLPHQRRRRRRIVRAAWVAAMAVIGGIGVGLFVRWANEHTSAPNIEVVEQAAPAKAVANPPVAAEKAPATEVAPMAMPGSAEGTPVEASPSAQAAAEPKPASTASSAPKPATPAPASKPAKSGSSSKSHGAELWLE